MNMNRYEGENARDICQDAILVQDACNLSGVAHSLAEMCSFLWKQGLETEAIKKHPAVILVVDKMNDLVGRPDFDAYAEAYKACRGE